MQMNAVYINTFGLMKLLLSGTKPRAVPFVKWVIEDVLFKIFETSQYKMEDSAYNIMKKQKEANDKKLAEIEFNNKRKKYPNEAAVYLLEFDDHDFKKIGKTDNMSERMPSYNTGRPNDLPIAYYRKTRHIHAAELCIKSKLYDKLVRDRKEFYDVSRQEAIDIINECVDSIEEKFKCTICSEQLLTTNDLVKHIHDTHAESILKRLRIDNSHILHEYTSDSDEATVHVHNRHGDISDEESMRIQHRDDILEQLKDDDKTVQ
jgi:hypothetical protein